MNSTNQTIPPRPKLPWPPFVGGVLCVLLYVLASYFTTAYFMGDTVDYVQSITEKAAGRNYLYWDFVHLLWRPLGYWLFRISAPITKQFVGGDGTPSAALGLIGLSWGSGLVCLLSLFGILNRVCRKKTSILIAVCALIGAHSFLNYTRTGAPFISGLALILVGLYLLVAQESKEKPALLMTVLAGVSLAVAGLFWFPYVLAIPSMLIAPLLLFGFSKQRLRRVLIAALISAVIGASAFFAVMANSDVHNVQEFRGWVEKTSRSADSSNRDVGKAVFGFGRSFLIMGNDELLYKRFLLHDPYSPVTVLDLLRLSLWKLLAFYLFILFILLSLISSLNGRRLLFLFMINVLPVIAFAIHGQGGDTERYLPLYPMFFIALAWAVDSNEVKRLFKAVLVVFVIAMIATNSFMMARTRVNKQQETIARRITDLTHALKPNTWIYTANWQDDLINFNRSFPLNEVNRNSELRIGALITPGKAEVPGWREEFATRVQSVWRNGGDLWISRRLLSERPRPEWNWAEGDDPHVSWKDLYQFASRLELGQTIGGEDGFVLVIDGPKNKAIMDEQSGR